VWAEFLPRWLNSAEYCTLGETVLGSRDLPHVLGGCARGPSSAFWTLGVGLQRGVQLDGAAPFSLGIGGVGIGG
jgi:hypothetical protein